MLIYQSLHQIDIADRDVEKRVITNPNPRSLGKTACIISYAGGLAFVLFFLLRLFDMNWVFSLIFLLSSIFLNAIALIMSVKILHGMRWKNPDLTVTGSSDPQISSAPRKMTEYEYAISALVTSSLTILVSGYFVVALFITLSRPTCVNCWDVDG